MQPIPISKDQKNAQRKTNICVRPTSGVQKQSRAIKRVKLVENIEKKS
jgi:hypothetical protein